jgi:capsular exopolysaccharide synthesis family protein
MVSSYLNVPEGLGVTSVLAGDATLDEAMTAIDDGRVNVLGSGPIPGNPSELLGSARMTAMLAELTATHDVVIVDAPPVLPVADALVLVGDIDAVVLVTKVGETTRERLKQATEAVLRVHGNLVGIVPNAVVQREDSAYSYAYRYRSRKGTDSLTLYTKKARKPQIEVPSADLAPAPTRTAADHDAYPSAHPVRSAEEAPPVRPEPVITPEPVSAPEPVIEPRPEPLPEPEPPVGRRRGVRRRSTPTRPGQAGQATASSNGSSTPDDKQREIAARIQAAFAAATNPDAPSRS